MATKKKTATKKTAPKGKRSPHQLFIVWDSETSDVIGIHLKKTDADFQRKREGSGEEVVTAGPYVLAERVRAK